MTTEELNNAKDYIRLNAKHINDIHPLLVEATHKVFGLRLDIPEFSEPIFRLKQVCNYHGAPMGKRTNWGGRDKNRPTSFIGWEVMNTRGTFRTDDGKEVTERYIREQTGGVYDMWDHRAFWTTYMLEWFNGMGTGTFNGGSNFMGCFRFFLDDYPLIKNNLVKNFHKEDIIRVYGIKDWNMYIRGKKVKNLISTLK